MAVSAIKHSNVVNGIDVTALGDIIEQVKDDLPRDWWSFG